MIGVGIIGIPVLKGILDRVSQEVDLTIYSFIPINKEDVPRGVRVRCLPRNIHQRIKYVLLGALFVRDHFRRPYHVVHAQSAFPGGVLARILGKLFRLPWMVTLIGGEVEAIPAIPFGDLLNPKLKRITISVCAEAGALTVMSKYQADSVRRNLGIERGITVLPYAPVVQLWADKKITHPVQLLHIGYYHPVKNHKMLLETARELLGKIPFKLTIIGDNYGPAFTEVIQQMRLTDSVDVMGYLPYEEISAHYLRCHILLHTSWYEGLPTVAFEAMAHGVAVCSTSVGLVNDLSGSHCVAVPPGDHVALANGVLGLVENPQRYEEIRRRAYAWAQANDQQHYVKQMVGLYRELSAE